jgi:type IX secretion system PorP/SprF family membrane protein
MERKFFSLFICILFFSAANIYSQDMHFSQYYANPLYLNPAFAGSAVCPRFIMNYRNQWPTLPGQYISYSASYDQYLDFLSGGVGLMFNEDDAGQGTINTTIISGMYSYKMSVSRVVSINLSFQASYFQNKLDWSKLTFNDMLSPKDGFIYNTNEKQPQNLVVGAPDFSSGLLVYGESFYAGLAVHHMTQPNQAFISEGKLPIEYNVNAGGIIDLRSHGKRRKIEDPTISPNILFMKQQDFEEINYGLYFNKYPLVSGIWFRQSFQNPDAFIVLLGFQTIFFKVGYSYDLTVSRLSSVSGGAHEISVGFQFGCKPKRKRMRAINCPVF